MREVIRQCYYDTKPIPNGGTGSLTFFTQPTAGQLNSNFEGQGMLPKPKEFYVLGIAVQIFPGYDVDIDDGITDTWAMRKKKIFETAYIDFFIGSKNYTGTVLKRVPEGVMTAGVGTGGENDNDIILVNGEQDVNHYWDTCVKNVGNMKQKPIHLFMLQNFYVRITWPTPAQSNHPFGTGHEAKVRVFLVGYLWREVM